MTSLAQVFYAIGDFFSGKLRMTDITTGTRYTLVVNDGTLEVKACS